jgi:hypothetical protein
VRRGRVDQIQRRAFASPTKAYITVAEHTFEVKL